MKTKFTILLLFFVFNIQAQKAQSYKSYNSTGYDKAGKLGTSSSPVSMIICKSKKEVSFRFGELLFNYKIISDKVIDGGHQFNLILNKVKTNHTLKVKKNSFSLSINDTQTFSCKIDEFKEINDLANQEYEE